MRHLLSISISLFVFCACVQRRSEPVATVLPGWEVTLTDSLLRAGMADTLDFGRVRAGENVVRTIRIRNGADRPLVILGVESSCGCVQLDFPRPPIPAGQAAEAAVWLHSGSFDPGPEIHPIALRTSLGAQRYRIIVTAEVVE